MGILKSFSLSLLEMAILLRKKDQKSLKKVNEKDWKIEKRLKKDHLSEVSLAYSLLTSFM